MTPTFNALANEVFAARKPDPRPVFKEPHAPVADDYRLALLCAAGQLTAAGFCVTEARAIAASASAGCAVAGDEPFRGTLDRAWQCANGTRALPRHPGGTKSARWIEAEALPKWAPKGYAEARSA